MAGMRDETAMAVDNLRDPLARIVSTMELLVDTA